MEYVSFKKLEAIYKKFCVSGVQTLHQCYKNPSDEKIRLWLKFVNRAIQLKSDKYGILTHNNHFMTFAMQYVADNKLIFVYITPTKERYCIVNSKASIYKVLH